MWNKIKKWWHSKTKKQRKQFVFHTILAVIAAIALMSLGSAIKFSVKGFNFVSLLYIAFGTVLGYFIGKNSDEDKDDKNSTK